ncbi:MAG TPA: helical backbone metal receptor [Roseiflexaceae bacterium]
MIVVDALGRQLSIADVPQRIVSLVPSLTEYLFAIGAGARVAGVTDYCVEPAAQVAGLPKVHGTKNPDRAGIRALRPDLVLASKEENRERDVAALAAAGVPVYVTDICSVQGALDQLAELAGLLAAERGAASLLDGLRAALEQAQPARPTPPRRALAFIWRDPWMAIGRDTYADDLLRLCGAENLARALDGSRYPRAPLDAFMALGPEVVLLPDEPYAFAAGDVAALAEYVDVPAVREGRVALCDGKLLTWYGPRTAEALRVLRGIVG